MRLTQTTDYAMRVLFYLGSRDDGPTPIDRIAEAYDLKRSQLVRVVRQLIGAGYVDSVRGRGGGLRLIKRPDEIFLGRIVRQVEPDMRLIDCVGCPILPACPLPTALVEATAAFVDVLDRYTLADILSADPRLEGLLGKL